MTDPVPTARVEDRVSLLDRPGCATRPTIKPPHPLQPTMDALTAIMKRMEGQYLVAAEKALLHGGGVLVQIGGDGELRVSHVEVTRL